MYARWMITRVVCATIVFAPVLSASANEGVAPEGLSASDWAGIRAAYETNRHAAFAVEGGAGVSPAYVARNPSQQWRTHFDGRGFLTTPEAGGWSWGLELIGYGRGDQRPDLFESPDRKGGVGAQWRGPTTMSTDRSLTVAALTVADSDRRGFARCGSDRPRAISVPRHLSEPRP